MMKSHVSPLIVLLFVFFVLKGCRGGQTSCVLEHCGLALAECEANRVCRQWSTCTRACGGEDLACQIRCQDLWKPTNSSSAKIDSFSECVISQHHCVSQTTEKCPKPEESSMVNMFDLKATLIGTWYITRGMNPLFDCFDCQEHKFTYDEDTEPREKPLHGDLKYNVKKDLNCSNSSCEYLAREVFQSFSQDLQMPGHLMNHNNSLAELHYADDWYVLYASSRAVLIYYCGCNDATCGYNGAVLYTRAREFSSSDPEWNAISKAADAAKIPALHLDAMCAPSNGYC